jgi:hypothetical protein
MFFCSHSSKGSVYPHSHSCTVCVTNNGSATKTVWVSVTSSLRHGKDQVLNANQMMKTRVQSTHTQTHLRRLNLRNQCIQEQTLDLGEKLVLGLQDRHDGEQHSNHGCIHTGDGGVEGIERADVCCANGAISRHVNEGVELVVGVVHKSLVLAPCVVGFDACVVVCERANKRHIGIPARHDLWGEGEDSKGVN